MDAEAKSYELAEKLSLIIDKTGLNACLIFLCVLLVGSSVAVSTAIKRKQHKQIHFRHHESGKFMVELDKDTRFSRFLKGQELSALGKKLAAGDPYLVRNGDKKELVIFSPSQLQEFHRKDANEHFKPFDMNMGHFAWQLLGDCLGQKNGSKWKVMRAHLDSEFSAQSAGKVMQSFQDRICFWSQKLLNIPETETNSSTVEIDIVAQCKKLVLGLIAQSVYGAVFDAECLDQLQSLNKEHEILLIIAFIVRRTTWKWYNKLPLPEPKMMARFQKRWKEFNLDIIQRARDGGSFCPIERIYTLVERGDLSIEEFLQTVDEMIFTNIDISGLIMAFIFQNLAKDTAFQSLLRQEVSLLDIADLSCLSSYISKQDSLLHYTTLESMRVTPSMHFSLPECNGSDKIIAGYHIPAGTPTIIDITRLNFNGEIWGEDASTFRPQRFVGLEPLRYRFGFVRWGIGRDKCLGKNMADMFLKLAVIAVLSRYELSPVTRESEEPGFKGKNTTQEGMTVGTDGRICLTVLKSHRHLDLSLRDPTKSSHILR